MDNKKRCKWCNLKNPLYVEYHDSEWCLPNFDDKYLYEMLLLESFQAGLSWECVLNKRESFRKAYDNFDISGVENLAKFLKKTGVLVLSHPDKAPEISELKLDKTRKYAAARISVYTK